MLLAVIVNKSRCVVWAWKWMENELLKLLGITFQPYLHKIMYNDNLWLTANPPFLNPIVWVFWFFWQTNNNLGMTTSLIPNTVLYMLILNIVALWCFSNMYKHFSKNIFLVFTGAIADVNTFKYSCNVIPHKIRKQDMLYTPWNNTSEVINCLLLISVLTLILLLLICQSIAWSDSSSISLPHYIGEAKMLCIICIGKKKRIYSVVLVL